MKKGIFLSLCMSTAFASDYQIHILKEGETLSELLHSKGYSPLYGKDNWVDKALQMNHLESVHAKEIKKGFPIILPHKTLNNISKQEVQRIRKNILQAQRKPLIKQSQTRVSTYNTISKHQDVSFGVALGQNKIKIDNTEVNQKENFKFDLNIEGKNNYKYNDITYNFYANLSVTTYGTGTYKNNSNKNLSLRPSTAFNSGLKLNHKEIPFSFGPSFTFEEKSLVNSSESELQTRRDQLGWIGFHADKKFDLFNEYFKTKFSYERKVFQSSLNDSASYEASRLNFDLGMHLTENYIAGISTTTINYSTVDLKNESSLAIKFNYLIK